MNEQHVECGLFQLGSIGFLLEVLFHDHKRKEMKIYFYQMIHFSTKRKLDFDNFMVC